jgi:hypothetical protein
MDQAADLVKQGKEAMVVYQNNRLSIKAIVNSPTPQGWVSLDVFSSQVRDMCRPDSRRITFNNESYLVIELPVVQAVMSLLMMKKKSNVSAKGFGVTKRIK